MTTAENTKCSHCLAMLIGGSIVATVFAFLWPDRVGDKSHLGVLTRSKLTNLRVDIESYRKLAGTYPKPDRWADDLLDSVGGVLAAPRISERFFDGWNRPIRYVNPGVFQRDGFDLYSVGQNGIDENGGGDDIIVLQP